MIRLVLVTHQGRYFSPGEKLKLKHIVNLDEVPPKFTRVKTLCGLSRLTSHVQTYDIPTCQTCQRIADEKGKP